METVLAVVIGGLYAAAIYMLLRRSIVKLLIGLGLLSHAANLLIFTAAGLTRGRAPVITAGAPAALFADPLPQALILTAIVIGFGVTAFALALAFRVYSTLRTDNLDRMREADA